MGEKLIVEIAQRLAAGKTVKDLATSMASPMVGAKEAAGFRRQPRSAGSVRDRARSNEGLFADLADMPAEARCIAHVVERGLLPTFGEATAGARGPSPARPASSTSTPTAQRLHVIQYYDRQAAPGHASARPLAPPEMDRIYDLPYTRKPHPSLQGTDPRK
ncbi:MAG: hypothetical protein U0744_15980 [Gemmataceae bacterium]